VTRSQYLIRSALRLTPQRVGRLRRTPPGDVNLNAPRTEQRPIGLNRPTANRLIDGDAFNQSPPGESMSPGLPLGSRLAAFLFQRHAITPPASVQAARVSGDSR
jgi:hypothetical protein